MSLPQYLEYKDSGESWLGDVPDHWEIYRLKFLFELMKRPPEEENEIVTAFRDGEVTLRTNRRVDGFTNSIKEIGYQGVRKGDLVIHAMDAFAGAIGVSDSDGKSTPVYSVCCPRNDKINTRYYGKLLRFMALSGFINSLAKGIRERSTEFRWVEAGNVSIPLPPFAEQSVIVDFLDRETGKIDMLVAEQEKLITLLKEKRQAIISHAITKGLDPAAPKKNSGIEWLGEVPEHWSLKRLGHFASSIGGGTPSRDILEFWGGGIPWITPKDMKSEFLNESEETITELGVASSSASIINSNHVLLVMRSGILRHTIPVGINLVSTAINQDIKAIDVTKELEPTYFLRFIQGLNRELLMEWGKQGATVESLETKLLMNSYVPIPPREEQHDILRFINRETSKMDALVTVAENAIVLLKERRSALISAAVTGKIDVRSLTEQEVTV
ncbi:restriction endonuclease subunit S [Paenibacillus mendelii]|uniref:Restriction endonuclease subunit S n=1 Tax=Paenibacillus mendelii TaxID=206163 RepID=A0ABV6JC98_9BACL|nr:restriction endonuclease subunit S [Paenibacillus mendelii]MCQ6561529.1 restriction endonuclease subunit S [Paenibacillus mendelii]